MYRAVEGQVHYWWVGLGNVIGSTILAYYWDDFAPALATNWDKVNLLNTFGPLGWSAGNLSVVVCRADAHYRLGKTLLPSRRANACQGVCMKNIVPDYRLDMVGEPCPYPAVATLEAMPQLKKGEILEVVSDCPQSINNIPLDARNHGYTVLDIQQDGPTIRYLIQK